MWATAAVYEASKPEKEQMFLLEVLTAAMKELNFDQIQAQSDQNCNWRSQSIYKNTVTNGIAFLEQLSNMNSVTRAVLALIDRVSKVTADRQPPASYQTKRLLYFFQLLKCSGSASIKIVPFFCYIDMFVRIGFSQFYKK